MKILSLFLTLLSVTRLVLAAPLPLEVTITDPKATENRVKYIAMVQKLANKYHINRMITILDNPTRRQNKLILETAFGHGWEQEISIITKNVQLFQTGKVIVDDTIGCQDCDAAVYNYEREAIALGKSFYPQHLHGAEEKLEVGLFSIVVLLHEAAHALFGAVDRFSKDKKFTPLRADQGQEASYFGYLENDFKFIRQEAGAKALVHNADSYMLFAHLAAKGLDAEMSIPKCFWQLDKASSAAGPSGSTGKNSINSSQKRKK